MIRRVREVSRREQGFNPGLCSSWRWARPTSAAGCGEHRPGAWRQAQNPPGRDAMKGKGETWVKPRRTLQLVVTGSPRTLPQTHAHKPAHSGLTSNALRPRRLQAAGLPGEGGGVL